MTSIDILPYFHFIILYIAVILMCIVKICIWQQNRGHKPICVGGWVGCWDFTPRSYSQTHTDNFIWPYIYSGWKSYLFTYLTLITVKFYFKHIILVLLTNLFIFKLVMYVSWPLVRWPLTTSTDGSLRPRIVSLWFQECCELTSQQNMAILVSSRGLRWSATVSVMIVLRGLK